MTVDPQADGFDPRPLKVLPACSTCDPRPVNIVWSQLYFEALGMDYFFEEQPILEQALSSRNDINSICSFCARMKRGRLYAAMRREG